MMKKDISDILKMINDRGYLSYIVGGAVRAILSDTIVKDIDIATNMPSRELKQIFPDLKVFLYDSSKVKYEGYYLEFTRLRKEIKEVNGKLIDYEYTDSLEVDSKRRDITINAIYMDKDFNIYDFYSGINDYQNKMINIIGDYNHLKSDPLRILRIIRFKVTLDFKISNELEVFIRDNISLLNDIDSINKEIEIKKIKSSSNYSNNLAFLAKINFPF